MKDLAIERAMLASLCQYGHDVLLDCSFLTSDHFNENNQILFHCIKSCLDSGMNVDITSILSKAQDLGYDKIICTEDEVSYIRSLFNLPVVKKNIPYYYEKLIKIDIAQKLRQKLKRSLEEVDNINGTESINDILGIIERPFFEITSELHNTSNHVESIGSDIYEYIEKLKDNDGAPIGIPSPFAAYNQAIGGGHRRKCVDLIGARSKVGKSLYANATALHVAKNLGIPVLYLDTEMDKQDQQTRILANLAEITMDDLTTGKFAESDDALNRIDNAAKTLEKIPYHYINISGQSFDTILSIMRRWIHQHVGVNDEGSTNDCLIIYDYLKLMSSDSISDNLQEYQALGFQITALRNFCVKYDVPCLTFVQLNRDGITKKSTDVISGSDRILWLCTSFSIFSIKSDEEQADDRAKGMKKPFNRKLDPIVARHGGCMDEGDYINIMMDGQYGRLTQGPTRNNLESFIREKDKGFVHDKQQPNFSNI